MSDSKTVVQLDKDGYFTGISIADESPLERGEFLMPAGSIDVKLPEIPTGMRAKWVEDDWVYEELGLTYAEKRVQEYPPVTDYLDGIVKGDAAQIEKYIEACKAVKEKYPKPSTV